MRTAHPPAHPAVPRAVPRQRNLAQVAWPVVKRLPAYLRLGWALGREPAIPRRHKALLVSAALYAVSPAQMVTGLIPVVGQIDSIALYLLGLRQALAHCPPAIARRHLEAVHLSPGQVDRDIDDVVRAAGRTIGTAARRAGREMQFAGRVAAGFSRRVLARLVRD